MNYYEKKGISQSFLKKWALSPAHAQVQHKSDSMSLGTLIHEILLPANVISNEIATIEQLLDKAKYIVEPAELMAECSTRAVTKYKDWKAEQTKEIIKLEDWQACEVIQRNFNLFLANMKIDNIPLQLMFDHGEREIEMFCQYKNETLKGKADWIYSDPFNDVVYLFDLKTTSNIHGVYWEVEKYKYHWQLPYYAYILDNSIYKNKVFKMFFVFIETSHPYYVRMVELSDMKAIAGQEAILTTLDDYITRKDDVIMPFDSEVIVI